MPSKRLTCITLTILLLILLELISSLEVLLQWEVNYYNILFFMFLFSFANMFSTLEILLWMVSQMRTSGQRWKSESLLLQKKQKDRFLFLALLSLRATPTAYGSSQARGPTGTVATGLCQSHSNTGSKLRLQPTLQRLRWILNPLSKGRDRTCNLMVPSRIR